MTFVQAAWLGLSALTLLVILLHIRRRRTVDVPSVQIWRILQMGAAPMRRLTPPPLSLLLLLQIAAILLLALALAEPRFGTVESGHRLYILDGSGSMRATDAAPRRFDAATDRLAALLAADPPAPDRRVSILLASPVPAVVAARLGESGALLDAVRALTPSDGTADWGRTADLARAVLRPGEATVIVLLGDGPADSALSRLVAGEAQSRLDVVTFGDPSTANIGFAALAATEIEDEPGRWTVEGDINLRGEAAGQASVAMEILFRPEGSASLLPWADVKVEPAAGATTAHFRTEIDLPGAGALEARLPDDAGPHDNRARLVLAGEQQPFQVLLVGSPSPDLLRALQALPDIELFAAETLPPDSATFDLVVVEGISLAQHPGASTLWIGGAGLASDAPPSARTDVRPTGWEGDHPLSAGVSWNRVEIARAYERQPHEGAEVLLETGAGALVEARRGGGISDVWVSFEIGESNWPTLAGFPAFFANLVDWVGSAHAADVPCRVGNACAVDPTLLTADTKLLTPEGKELPFAPIALLAASPSLPRSVGDSFVPLEAGFHRIVSSDRERLIAVNAFAPSEADLAVPQSDEAPASVTPGWAPHLWWVLGLVSLAILLIEGWLAGRGSERFLTRRALGGANPLAMRHRIVLGLRIGAIALLLLAIVGIPRPGIGPLQRVVVVAAADLPADTAGSADIVALRNRLAQRGDEGVGLVTLAARPALSAGLGETAAVSADDNPNPGADAEIALALAAASVPHGEKGRIVLASDGTFTRGDVGSALASISGRNLSLELVPLTGGREGDVAVAMLSAPDALRAGDSFPLEAVIVAGRAGEAEVTVLRDHVVIGSQAASLTAGTNRVETEIHEEGPGRHLYEVTVSAPGDPLAENDRNTLLVDVAPLPSVAVVTPPAERGAAETLIQALQVQGLSAELVLTTHTLWSVADWLRFDEVVLMNVPAIDLDTRQQEAIEAIVEEHGRGLIILGGENSFGPGGYYETPLERVSPLSSRIPRDAPRVALVFVLDRSGSMNQRVGDASRLDVAKSATMSALGLLNEESQVGVVVFDSEATVVVPLQDRLDAPAVEAALAPLEPGGGTSIYPGLLEAQVMLRGVDAAARHIIVMTDGLSQPGEFRRVLQELSEDGITVSTVAIGEGADVNRLQEIARLGQGTFHATRDFKALPSILSQEALLLSGTPVKYGAAQPFWLDRDEPFLAGMPEELPPLLGYVLTTAKEEASLHLAVPQEDGEIAPILASWRYGNGRVLALATHGAGDWTSPWLEEPAFPLFWAQVVRSFLPETQGPGLHLVLVRAGDEIRVTVDALGRSGENRVGLDVAANVVVPGSEEPVSLMLSEMRPGRYEGGFLADAVGVFAVDASVGDQRVGAAISVAYPAIYEAGRAEPEVLADLARATGGTILGERDEVRLDSGMTLTAEPGWRLWACLALLVFLADLVVRYAPGLFGRRRRNAAKA